MNKQEEMEVTRSLPPASLARSYSKQSSTEEPVPIEPLPGINTTPSVVRLLRNIRCNNE